MPGIHIPQQADILPDYGRLARELEVVGYDRIWVGEVNDIDAVSAATLAATATEAVDIGVFLNVFTRAPTTLAMTGSALAHLAPGRIQLVLGSGSPQFVQTWNGIPFAAPYSRLRDTLRFLRTALTGERVSKSLPTISGTGFSLASAPTMPPSLCIAAAGPRTLALACEEADGVALNWITPTDLAEVRPLPVALDTITLIVPMCPTRDRAAMDEVMRPVVATYLNVPGYAQQQRRLGRGEHLAPMWRAWADRDPRAARTALPDDILDDFVIWGSIDHCQDRLEKIEAETGISVIAIVFPPRGFSFADAVLDRRRR